MNRKPIAGRAGYDIEATPATEYGEDLPIIFLSMHEADVPLSVANGVEDELTIDAAKALIGQLQEAIDKVESEHTWNSFHGDRGTLKIHDCTAIEDDPLFSMYVEQEEHTAFSFSFSQAEQLVRYLTTAMANYRGAAAS